MARLRPIIFCSQHVLRRADLYFAIEELVELEKTDPDFVNLENEFPILGGGETIESNSRIPDISSNISRGIIRRSTRAERLQSKNKLESVSLSSPDLEKVTTLVNQPLLPKAIESECDLIAQVEKPKIGETPGKNLNVVSRCSRAEKLPGENNSESESPPSRELETVATLDNQSLLSGEIDEKSNLTVQVKKKLIKNNQPPKKKEKLDIHNVDEVVEPIPLCKDEKELPPTKSQPFPEERYLCKDEIIGNKKKGIKGIISMSNSKWYAGISKGVFPKQLKLDGKSYWKESDIRKLQERIEKGELNPKRKTSGRKETNQ